LSNTSNTSEIASKISVIVCTYNRVRFIHECLEHLKDQTLENDDYEIIVINNNSNDNTAEVVEKFISETPQLDIKQVEELNQGLSFARNRGLQEAKYDIICYIDDDGYAKANYLEEIQKIFIKNKVIAGVGGKVIPQYEDAEPDWYNPYLRMMVTSIDFGDKSFKCKGKKYPAGCSMIYRKQYLIKAKGFNNKLKWRADDKYIFHEVSKLTDEIYYMPQLEVKHCIDRARTTDENFDKLSGLLGSEERIRILGEKKWAYPFKIIEFVFKYFASILIALFYTVKGESIKGKYTIRFRWLALLKFIKS